jgi:hypothetical protein
MPAPSRSFVVSALVLALGACRGAGPSRSSGAGAAAGADASASPAEAALARDLIVTVDFATHAPSRIEARPGASVPVEGLWSRLDGRLRVPPASLVPEGPPAPSTSVPGGTSTWYQQMHLGHPVAGYGYHVEAEHGLLRTATGHLMPDLPASLPAAITRDEALTVATRHLAARGAGAPPPPASEGRLVLWSGKQHPTGADFQLVWSFDFAGDRVIVDAQSGAVLVAE